MTLLEEQTIRETVQANHGKFYLSLKPCPHLDDEPVFLYLKRLGWVLCPECFQRSMDAQAAKNPDPQRLPTEDA